MIDLYVRVFMQMNTWAHTLCLITSWLHNLCVDQVYKSKVKDLVLNFNLSGTGIPYLGLLPGLVFQALHIKLHVGRYDNLADSSRNVVFDLFGDIHCAAHKKPSILALRSAAANPAPAVQEGPDSTGFSALLACFSKRHVRPTHEAAQKGSQSQHSVLT